MRSAEDDADESSADKDLEACNQHDELGGIAMPKPVREQDAQPTLSRTISATLGRRSTRSFTRDPGPPPDGGHMAWTQAVMGHLTVFSTWGYINSFGVFQAYYVDALGRSPSDISWVGSVQIFMLFFIGTFSGRLTDAGYFRSTFLVGSILQLVGVFMTSISTKYWQLFLAQGICTGIGNGLLFCPVLALISTYFLKRRSLAISIAASGTGTGGMVFPAIVQQLLPKIGFPWTIRVLGFVMIGTLSVINMFTRPRLPPRRTGPLVEWGALKEIPYVLFSLGMFLIFWGTYFAFYYIGTYAQDIIGEDQKDSFSLILIINGVGVLGRLVPGLLADHFFGPLNILIPFSFMGALMIFCWIAVTDRAGLIVFAIIYGFFTAGIQSLFPATLSTLTKDLRKTGVRMGMVFSIISFASLTGAPIAGALIQRDNGRYVYAQVFAGSIMASGCLTLVAARIASTGPNLRKRV